MTSFFERGGRIGLSLREALDVHPQLTATVTCCVVLLFRSWPRFVAPEFWAEDGALFFEDAATYSVASIARPYAGYFHVVPRAVALIIYALISPINWPLATAVCSVGIASVCLAFFSRSTFRWVIRQTELRVGACIIFCFLPGTAEILGNLANLHWLLFFVAGLGVLSARTRAFNVWSVALIALAALSAGETLLLIPLLIASLIVPKPSVSTIFASLAVLTCVVLMNIGLQATSRADFLIKPGDAFDIILKLVAILPLFGLQATVNGLWLAALASAFALITVVITAAWQHPSPRLVILKGVWLGSLAAMPLLVAAVRPEAAEALGTAGALHITRYNFIPAAGGCMLWLLCADALIFSGYPARVLGGSLAVVLAVQMVNFSTFQLPVLSSSPRWQKEVRDGACVDGRPIPIAPAGWSARCLMRASAVSR